MYRFSAVLMTALLVANGSVAEPLSEMAGSWRGTGWARETQEGPRETLRCKITNTYDTAARTLTLKGQCVVPGRKLRISGTLNGAKSGERITGRWSNPDGAGSARILGVQRDGIVAFNFNATDPTTGRKHAQNVEWRVSKSALRLRSTDRDDPSIMMSDISFGK